MLNRPHNSEPFDPKNEDAYEYFCRKLESYKYHYEAKPKMIFMNNEFRILLFNSAMRWDFMRNMKGDAQFDTIYGIPVSYFYSNISGNEAPALYFSEEAEEV